jgi:predicted dehydrogenase
MSQVPSIGVGMVGYAFMGRAHSQAWQAVSRAFDPPLRPRLAAICGRDETATRAAASRLGWAAAETDWRALIARDDVQLVDIVAPGNMHAPIAIAALRAGKHVLCEKPLANTLAEAAAMAAAADAAFPRGARAMVGFNYRRVPAIALARRLIEAGRVGTVRHVRAVYLQDWLVDPDSPLTWRLQAEQAGSGALGDLGSHVVDLARFLTGDEIVGVSALSATFIDQRPLPGGSGNGDAEGGATGTGDAEEGATGTGDAEEGATGTGDAEEGATGTGDASGAGSASGTGRVTVDDAVVFSARFGSGALGSFEATRYATGRKNALRIELNGSAGSLAFDLERLNELEFYDGDDTDAGTTAGFRRILVTEAEHPYLSGWWPPGHILGWEHTFTHQAKDLLTAIADGAQPRPSFGDGLAVQRVLDAVQRSAAAGGGWETIGRAG